jgi:uncharacterized membrane protein YqiK
MRYMIISLILLGLSVMLLWGIDAAGNSMAQRELARGQAEAMLIRAQAESRLATSTAMAISLTAALPWGILAILGILGLAVIS